MSKYVDGIRSHQQQLFSGQRTCRQAVDHFLGQIKQHQHLNAMVAVFNEDALARASELDTLSVAEKQQLPLFGVVVSIKDVICYKGHTVTASSKMLQGFSSQFNATVVERLLNAGAIIIGSTNCDEFAMGSTNENSFYGPVKNAVNPGRVPGGSSGGAAVSVQAGLCMIAIGSDTGGSVRQPADFCGLVGFKPTYGRISRHGLIAYASSFDCIGIIANNVEDVAITYDVIAGPDEYDATAIREKPVVSSFDLALEDNKKLRIAYIPQTLDGKILDPEIQTTIRENLDALEAEGHEVVAVDFDLLNMVVPAYYVLTTAEASSNLSRYDGIRYGHTEEEPADLTALYRSNRTHGFGEEVKRRIMLGTFVLSAGYYDAYYTRAQQVRKKIIDAIALMLNQFDAILLPVSPNVAPHLGELGKADPIEMYMADIYTVFANLAGVPAITIPVKEHSNGMPYGFQLMGAARHELALLQVAAYFQNKLAASLATVS